MSNFRPLSILLMISLIGLAFACGSAPTGNSPSNVAGGNSVPGSNSTGGVVDNSNAPSTINPSNQPIAGITGPANSAPTDPNAPSAGNLEMANRRRVVDVPGEGPTGPPPSIPAPEGSTMLTTMNKDGSFMETRTFSADPDINKLERVSNGKSQIVKVFLKSGRVVQVPSNKVTSVNSIPLATIKTLVGIKAPAAPKFSPQQVEELKKKKVEN